MASCPLRKCHVSVFPASIFWRSEMGKGDCMWVDVPSRFPCRAVRSFGGWLGSRRRMKLSGSLLGGEESLSWTLGRSRTSKIFVCSTVFFLLLTCVFCFSVANARYAMFIGARSRIRLLLRVKHAFPSSRIQYF